ncbi:hypothetical protein PLANTIT3_61273 [Plantibacter sp. T3]|nr:hypothetical protein PLANTIT3_61273 [Plantibacter sp. T3]
MSAMSPRRPRRRFGGSPPASARRRPRWIGCGPLSFAVSSSASRSSNAGMVVVLARDAEESVSSDSGAREVGPLRGVSLAAGSLTLESPDDAVVGSADDAAVGAGSAVSLVASSSTGSDGVEAASAASRC